MNRTPLTSNTSNVWVIRNGQSRHVGMIDHTLRLYQWAPAKKTGTFKNVTFAGCVSLGADEWDQIVGQIDLLELNIPVEHATYHCDMVDALAQGSLSDTPNGKRYLIPQGCFTKS